MPRMLRYQIVDVPQHVVQRGNNRQLTFDDDRDRHRYLLGLAHALDKHKCDLHAYVLMDNHAHLLMTPRRPMAIARLMQDFGSRYVRYFNGRHSRSGTLWEGRYHASLVATGRYFLACSRYIEMNPVRAGLVAHPQDYPWSSYARNALGRGDVLVIEHPEYTDLGRNSFDRAAAYRLLFDREPGRKYLEEIRVSLKGCRVFGPDRFKDDVEARLGRSVRPLKPGPRPRCRA